MLNWKCVCEIVFIFLLKIYYKIKKVFMINVNFIVFGLLGYLNESKEFF